MHGYTVGITVHLVDHVTGGLGRISTALQAAGSQTTAFEKKMERLQGIMDKLQVAQNLGSTAFNMSVGAINEMIEPAKEYAQIINMMNMQGTKHQEIQENIKYAWEQTNKVTGTTVAENLKALIDLKNVFNDIHEARELAPDLMKAKMILAASVDGPVSKNAESMVFDMAKAIDQPGHVQSPEAFRKHLFGMTKVMQMMSGKVLPGDYLSFFKYSRQSKFDLDEKFLYGVLPELLLENKGGGGGVAGGVGPQIAALFRFGVQGIMNKRSAQSLYDMGLVPENSILKTTTTGTTLQGGLVGAEMLQKNPFEWVQTVFRPALERSYPELIDKNAKPGSGISDAQSLQVAQIFKGNQLATSLVIELLKKPFQYERFSKRIEQAPDFETSYELAQKSPQVAQQVADAAWENLKTVVGTEIIPLLVPGLQMLAGGLRTLAQFFRDHPLAAQIAAAVPMATALVGGVVALGAAIASTGIVVAMLGITASVGEIALAIAGVVGGLTALIVTLMNWSTIQAKITETWNAFGTSFTAVMHGMDLLYPRLVELINTVLPGISNWIQSLYELWGAMNPIQKFIADSLFGTKEGSGKGATRGEGVGLQPGTAVPKGANGANSKVEIQPGAIQINQQPGENAEDLAEKVLLKITQMMHDGLISTVTAGGALFAPITIGGN